MTSVTEEPIWRVRKALYRAFSFWWSGNNGFHANNEGAAMQIHSATPSSHTAARTDAHKPAASKAAGTQAASDGAASSFAAQLDSARTAQAQPAAATPGTAARP